MANEKAVSLEPQDGVFHRDLAGDIEKRLASQKQIVKCISMKHCLDRYSSGALWSPGHSTYLQHVHSFS